MLQSEEKFQIIINSHICSETQKIVQHLYQPIIGVNAVSLYFALLNEQLSMKVLNLDNSHLRLQNLLQLSLLEIEVARNRLEAINLFDVYRNNTNIGVTYYYELFAPMAPQDFFNHQQFNQLLIDNLSLNDYERTKFLFMQYQEDLSSYKKITKCFNEVFSLSIVKADASSADFIFQTNHLSETNKQSLEVANEDMKNPLQKKIYEMQTISPYKYLTLLQNFPLQAKDLQLLAKLLVTYTLSPEVTNCLIEYVWYKNNKLLVVAYLEKIASTLQQKQITTVEQAMIYLRTAYVQSFNKEKIKSNKIVKKSKFDYEIKWNMGIIPKWLQEDPLCQT
ncbi:DnaD domain protein [Spiroplasma endosymbiont of 'Nebria riversi']|uniref:DnaD domain protein n=1 Tax=Spiroplasma endosymbiont of 'Nebria riversi' TaxID=2792084 RepID=UPI001C04F274|nr:DnaD domain protein [Spiroplasma endosymbiont of 'Nebria riversi']